MTLSFLGAIDEWHESCSFLTVFLNTALSLRFICFNQNVKYQMPRGFIYMVNNSCSGTIAIRCTFSTYLWMFYLRLQSCVIFALFFSLIVFREDI